MPHKFSKYLLSAFIIVCSLGFLSGCKANKCDCPNFHGEVVVEQAEC
ncbi:hypothetical protein BH09BAC1_BH09BAC1_09780 [soil metagenome]